MEEQDDGVSRRRLVQGLIAGAAGVLGLSAKGLAAEPPLETTKLMLHHSVSICQAPQYVAEDLLRAEGFTEVKYMSHEESGGHFKALGSGAVDLMNDFAPMILTELDKDSPIVTLAGLHVGCFQLIGFDRVRALRDLKGKTVGGARVGHAAAPVPGQHAGVRGSEPAHGPHLVDPALGRGHAAPRRGEGRCVHGFPPEPQELRARKIGHVIVDSSRDRPWLQYFCCMTVGNREFVRKNPVATKRALRAFMKANDICAAQPERAARTLVDQGVTKRGDYALQTVTEVPYSNWRLFDPEDTMRFYALRLHETGVIKTSPNKLIAQGVNWRFLKELKKELKA